jgi:hypothetical protein
MVVVVIIMMIHGYLSIQQDQESLERELRVGMRGFSRVLQSTLAYVYADQHELAAAEQFIDTAGPTHRDAINDSGAHTTHHRST